MALERTVVNVAGPLCIVSGLVCAAAPATLAGLAGISADASGLTDIRAVYGGLQIGLGAFLLWCRADAERYRAGLMALGLGVGAVGGVRVLGFLVDQAPNAFHLANLSLEIAVAAIVWLALAKRSRVQVAQA